jgi:hypothetical protein
MWMTPNVPNGGRHVPQELVASKGTMEDGTKRTVGLESQTKYWATPDCNTSTYSNGKMGLNIREQAASWNANSAATNSPSPAGVTDVPTAKATGWPTPKGTDGTKGGPNQAGSKGDLMLPSAAAQWPTPAARDAKGANSAEHALVTGGGAQAHGPTEQLCRPFFAPGPADAGWPAILREWPGLAPALDKTAESGLRGVADGLASGMDHCRAQRLKCVGNGVVALCAAAAVVVLVRRMMEVA